MRARLRSPLLLLLALCAGCDYSGPAPGPAVDISQQAAATTGARDSSAVTAIAGGLLITGLSEMPTSCHQLSGEATRAADAATVTLRPVLPPGVPGCAQSVGRVSYRARVAPLAPGSYTVVVREEFGPARTGEIARARITVP